MSWAAGRNDRGLLQPSRICATLYDFLDSKYGTQVWSEETEAVVGRGPECGDMSAVW